MTIEEIIERDRRLERQRKERAAAGARRDAERQQQVQHFLNELTERRSGDRAHVKASELFQLYLAWCARRPVPAAAGRIRTFIPAVRACGVTAYAGHSNVTHFRGIVPR